MSLSQFAAPACSVEVYPFEGGPITLTGGQIRSVTVNKTLLGAATGEFTIELTPGGPLGTETPLTWSQIMTPMSHVLIGMSRGADAAIVMDGVLTTPSEDQIWSTRTDQGSSAARANTLAGGDFGWFYQRFNYYALTFFGLTAGNPKIGGGNLPLGLSLPAILSQGLIGGTSSANSNPVLVGQAWYNDVMAGTSGLLSKTYVPFSGGSRYLFPQTMTQVWERYPDVFIPYADNFMTGAESWAAKFLSIFPHPWYEFFVTTAPAGAYVPAGAETVAGAVFTMQSMPYARPAGPVMVTRINPVPAFTLEQLSSAGAAVPGDLDTTRWNALPLYDLSQVGYSFLSSSVGFSASDATNFYQMNPLYYKTLAPGNNANSIPATFFYIAAADPASVQRYGFSPKVASTHWMCDPLGTAAQNLGLNITQTILALTGRLISWHHPTPLMARGQLMLPLSPNLMVGTRLRYAPFKNGELWDFYVTGVQHKFVFGGNSYTRLTLSRGLPAAIYADGTSDGLLRAIHTGNAMRQSGRYVVGLPEGSEQALQVIETPQQVASLTGHLATVFVTPQSGAS